jgi:hypothetical protein
VRSTYADGQGISFLAHERLAKMASEEFRELFTQVDDPWFSKPGGGLGVTEVALLLPGLALCLASLRRRDRRGEALLLLAVLPITLLPGVLAPDPSFRRLLLVATMSLFLAALVLLDLGGRLRTAGIRRGVLAVGVTIFATGYAAVNSHIYFDLAHLNESESHQYHNKMVGVVRPALGIRYVTIVVGHEWDVEDHAMYLELGAHDALAALGVRGLGPPGLYRVVLVSQVRPALDDLRSIGGRALVLAEQYLVRTPFEGVDLPALIAQRFPGARAATVRASDGSDLLTAWEIDVRE